MARKATPKVTFKAHDVTYVASALLCSANTAEDKGHYFHAASLYELALTAYTATGHATLPDMIRGAIERAMRKGEAKYAERSNA